MCRALANCITYNFSFRPCAHPRVWSIIGPFYECIIYLLLCNKLSPELGASNNKHLLFHSVPGIGIQAWLSWTLGHRVMRLPSARAEVSSGHPAWVGCASRSLLWFLAAGLRAASLLVPCWPRSPSIPCHLGLSTGQLQHDSWLSSEQGRVRKREKENAQDRSPRNPISEVASHRLPCSVHPQRASRSSPRLKQGDFIGHEYQEAGVIVGHPRGCLLH